MTSQEHDVPAIYRFWLPLSILLAGAVIGYASNYFLVNGQPEVRRVLSAIISSERGLIELATAATLVLAIYHGVRSLAVARRIAIGRLLLLWTSANVLGAVYFLGEEISWGQHFFAWETGDWFAQRNDQQETNFHNMSSWLDQKPRSLLFIWCVLGGIIVPLWYRFRNLPRPDRGWAYWVWPTGSAVFVAILIAFVRFPDQLMGWWDVDVSDPIRYYFQSYNGSEMQEFLYASFILIYLFSLRSRITALHAH